MNLSALDRQIINSLQGGFPIAANPWDELASSLNISVDELIQHIDDMQQAGYISRFGPMYHAEKMGGGLTLAAMKVPEERYDEVSNTVNSMPEIAHNYAREHELNMWFVIATETPEQIASVIADIEQQTGIRVYNMPKQKEYFLGLKFEV